MFCPFCRNPDTRVVDSRTSEEVLQMFQRLNEEEGITIILVTHALEVAEYANRAIKIRDGLIESGAFTEHADQARRNKPEAPAAAAAPVAAMAGGTAR